MKHSTLPVFCFLVLLGSGIQLRADDLKSLLENSPFGPTAGAQAAGAAQELEFRGVVQEAEIYLINLYNPAAKTSQWLALHEPAADVVVHSYDPATGEIQLSRAGRPLRLSLKQARVSLVQAAQPVAPEEAGNPAARDDRANRPDRRDPTRPRGEGGEPPDFNRPPPPEVQQMMQEVRRRRAERGGARAEETPPPAHP